MMIIHSMHALNTLNFLQKQVVSPLFIMVLASVGASLVSCGITSLPANVQGSITQTESNISATNNKLINSTSAKQTNFITHDTSGYFGNQVIMQNNTDYLPAVFNNTIQIDKQFLGLKSLAGSLTELIGIPTVIDISTPDISADNCNDVRITQQEGNLLDLLNLIGARCDLSWTYLDGKLILSDTETKTWIVKNIPGDVQVQNQVNTNSDRKSVV